MTPPNPTPDTTTTVVGDVSLRVLCVTALTTVHALLPQVRDLQDTRQASLPFLSVEARRVMDQLVRDERDALAYNHRENIQAPGQAPAPVSIVAVSILATWHQILVDTTRTLDWRLRRHGLHPLHGPTRIPLDTWRTAGRDITDEHRYAALLELLPWVADDQLLQPLHRHLEDLHDRAVRLIDGVDTKQLPHPCPWCHRHTLVAHLQPGVIRCESDPHTGRREPCHCTDSYCPCHDGGTHRHEWHRDTPGHKTGSWHDLARLTHPKPPHGDTHD